MVGVTSATAIAADVNAVTQSPGLSKGETKLRDSVHSAQGQRAIEFFRVILYVLMHLFGLILIWRFFVDIYIEGNTQDLRLCSLHQPI
jgi:hypothetical protein